MKILSGTIVKKNKVYVIEERDNDKFEEMLEIALNSEWELLQLCYENQTHVAYLHKLEK